MSSWDQQHSFFAPTYGAADHAWNDPQPLSTRSGQRNVVSEKAGIQSLSDPVFSDPERRGHPEKSDTSCATDAATSDSCAENVECRSSVGHEAGCFPKQAELHGHRQDPGSSCSKEEREPIAKASPDTATSASGMNSGDSAASHAALLNDHQQRISLADLPPALVQEILAYLDPRCLSLMSCVSHAFRKLASESRGWKEFYCERWEPPVRLDGCTTGSLKHDPGPAISDRRWRDLYFDREIRSRAMSGRFRVDLLHGHTAGVRCARMLPSANLAVTAGYDSAVRLWDLDKGLPLAASAPLLETLRAVAMDEGLLAVAGTDAAIRIWRASAECPHRFDVAGMHAPASGHRNRVSIHGHSGPISCLELGARHLYSGSWDMTVRMWDRAELACSQAFSHADWVWASAARGCHLVSTAGGDQYSWDLETGKLLRLRRGVHEGHAYAVEATRSGQYVFTGGADGAIRMFDERVPSRAPSAGRQSGGSGNGGGGTAPSGAGESVAVWAAHSGAVHSLALEDPWLVSASADGTCAMVNARAVMSGRAAGASGCGRPAKPGKPPGVSVLKQAEAARPLEVVLRGAGEAVQRKLGGFDKGVYSVAVGNERILCAGEDPVVRVFDFSQALEVERRMQAMRSLRSAERVRRRQVASTAFLAAQQSHGAPRRGGKGTQAASEKGPQAPAATSRLDKRGDSDATSTFATAAIGKLRMDKKESREQRHRHRREQH